MTKILTLKDFEEYFKSTENSDEYLCCNDQDHLPWSHCQATRIERDLLKKFKDGF